MGGIHANATFNHLLSGSHFYKDRSKKSAQAQMTSNGSETWSTHSKTLKVLFLPHPSLCPVMAINYYQNLSYQLLSPVFLNMTPLPPQLFPPKISTGQQCIFPDSKHQCHCFTASILSNTDNSKVHSERQNRPSSIKTTDSISRLSPQHQSVKLASETSTGSVSGRLPEIMVHIILDPCRITQSFFKVLTHSLFRERCCPKYSTTIPNETTYCEHLVKYHCPSCSYPCLV